MIATVKNLSVKEWLHGLLSTVINGAAGAVGVILVDPVDFNFTNGKWKLLQMAGAMALVQGALFLKDRPLPKRWKDAQERELSHIKEKLHTDVGKVVDKAVDKAIDVAKP